MKIWIDARICDENSYYGQYVCELVEAFVKQNFEHEIIVYRKDNCKFNRFSLLDDYKTKKLFEKENFALMIFFDHHIPHGYKWDFFVMIENLKEVFFPKKKFLARKIYRYKLQKAIERSQRVLCLDGGTALELNEQLNIPEDKISTIPWFFPTYTIPKNKSLKIDVRAKHNIRTEYLIYDSGNELHNNFERILKTLKNLKQSWTTLGLIILCDATNNDVDIRNKALEYGIAEQILFLGTVKAEIEAAYYTQAFGVIFSSIYESFPFQFTKALAYNAQIFANDIPANKQVMQDAIFYLDPLSIHNMSDLISEKLSKKSSPDYTVLQTDFSAEISAEKLSTIISIKK